MRLRSSLLSFSFASLTFFFTNVASAGDAVVVPLYSPNMPAWQSWEHHLVNHIRG